MIKNGAENQNKIGVGITCREGKAGTDYPILIRFEFQISRL